MATGPAWGNRSGALIRERVSGEEAQEAPLGCADFEMLERRVTWKYLASAGK